MKKSFECFRDIGPERITRAWTSGTVIFDTSVLLNLYRYGEKTRNEYIQLLDAIKDRVWLPYHVALEFNKNRRAVIEKQLSIFNDVEEATNKSLSTFISDIKKLQNSDHTISIDIPTFISNIKETCSNFTKQLKEQRKNSLAPDSFDYIRTKLDDIFDGRTGNAPESQTEIDKIYDIAKKRYDRGIPPGFLDRSKKPNSQEEFDYFGGLTYNKEYSDYLIWNQILQFSAEKKVQEVIFVTNDSGIDWWALPDSATPIPRPELNDEAHQKGIKTFLMYRANTFLDSAAKQLQRDISATTISEVRKISEQEQAESFAVALHNSRNEKYESLFEDLVFKWIRETYKERFRLIGTGSVEDIVAQDDNNNIRAVFSLRYIPHVHGVSIEEQTLRIISRQPPPSIIGYHGKVEFHLILGYAGGRISYVGGSVAKVSQFVLDHYDWLTIGYITDPLETTPQFIPTYNNPVARKLG